MRYPVLQPLLHDGRPYAPGAAVDLDGAQAAPLAAAAVIDPIPLPDEPPPEGGGEGEGQPGEGDAEEKPVKKTRGRAGPSELATPAPAAG